MKNLRKIALFTGILFALFFLGSQKTEAVGQIQAELPAQYSQEGLHALAFLQPEASHQVISNATTAFAATKWMGIAETFFLHTAEAKIRKSFFFQDINRCETVSLLLFPFHIFW